MIPIPNHPIHIEIEENRGLWAEIKMKRFGIVKEKNKAHDYKDMTYINYS